MLDVHSKTLLVFIFQINEKIMMPIVTIITNAIIHHVGTRHHLTVTFRTIKSTRRRRGYILLPCAVSTSISGSSCAPVPSHHWMR